MCVCVRARKDESTEGGQRAELSLDTSLPPPPPLSRLNASIAASTGFLAAWLTILRRYVVSLFFQQY